LYAAHNSGIAGGHDHAVDVTVGTVALRSCGVRPTDVCFHNRDNATRPDLTAALVYVLSRVVRRRRCLLTAAGCEPEQVHYLASGR
jgi:hypothetical protein